MYINYLGGEVQFTAFYNYAEIIVPLSGWIVENTSMTKTLADTPSLR